MCAIFCSQDIKGCAYKKLTYSYSLEGKCHNLPGFPYKLFPFGYIFKQKEIVMLKLWQEVVTHDVMKTCGMQSN